MELKGKKNGFDPEVFKQAVKVSIGMDGQFIPVQVFDAIVQSGSQDEDNMTCVVDSVNSNVNNLTVRYNLCISDGEVNIPEDESTVTIIKTAFTDPYIVRATDLKSKFIGIGNQSWSNDGTIQEFKFCVGVGEPSGTFGGFIKSLDPEDPTKGLLAKIQQLENKVNLINAAIQSTIIPLAPSGTYPLTTNPAVNALSNIVPITTSSDIENPNITHGLENLPT